MALCLIGIYINEFEAVLEKGLFQYYNMWTWGCVVSQVIGGFLVAFVMKYADNILKTFSTSLSILFSSIASIYFFDFQLTLNFSVGVILVLASIYMYTSSNMDTKPYEALSTVEINAELEESELEMAENWMKDKSPTTTS